MIRALIIDDEKACIDSLEFEINNHCPDVEVLERCTSGKEGIKAIHRHKPDLLFLDIDMPFINGFDLLEMVPDIDFEVIFTTAYDKYALRAFRISAMDYLLKPVDPDELKKAVNKVKKVSAKGEAQKQMDFLIQQIKDIENNSVQKIALPTIDGLEFINLDDILYCQSDGAYSNVFFKEGGKLLISKTLRWLEEALCDFHFFRVHNSYIINLHYVRKYSKSDGGMITMENGDTVKVSRSKKEKLLNMF